MTAWSVYDSHHLAKSPKKALTSYNVRSRMATDRGMSLGMFRSIFWILADFCIFKPLEKKFIPTSGNKKYFRVIKFWICLVTAPNALQTRSRCCGAWFFLNLFTLWWLTHNELAAVHIWLMIWTRKHLPSTHQHVLLSFWMGPCFWADPTQMTRGYLHPILRAKPLSSCVLLLYTAPTNCPNSKLAKPTP